MRFYARGLGWVGLAMLVAACGDDPFAPPPMGRINLTVTTVGDDIDSDGYVHRVDARSPQPVGTTAAVTIESLEIGTHIVSLEGVALNCTVDGASWRSVEVTSTISAPSASFTVSCARNGDLAFVDGISQNIYALNADGTGTAELTKNLGRGEPVFSPDGSRLAFVRYRNQTFQGIYVMNLNGSGTVSLTTAITNEFSPAWSPDGSRIAFASGALDNSEIHVMNADGTNRLRLTTSTTRGGDADPAWSPDGSRIAFTRNSKIHVMNPDGSGVTQVSADGANDSEPAWSPDGRMIAFSRGSAIFTMEADGSNATRVTQDLIHAGNPAWSKDGRIAVETADCSPDPWDVWGFEVCSGEILVVRPDKTTYYVTAGLALHPTWRP